MKTSRRLFLLFLSLITTGSFALAEEALNLTLRTRQVTGTTQVLAEKWLPSQTAIIVCDMWDLHPCKSAFLRETEMAPKLNEVLEKARSQGVLIIHAPSACMAPYEQTPAQNSRRVSTC